jgi:hypothetical protein
LPPSQVKKLVVRKYVGKTGRKNIRWDKEIQPIIKEQLSDFDMQGFSPTLRGLFYTLVELGVIPKTEDAYEGLGRFMTRVRKNALINKKNVSKLDPHCLADHTREIVREFNDKFLTLNNYLDDAMYRLEFATDNYIRSVPRWYGQKHHVEVWIEKDAMVEPIVSILKNRDVIIIPNRGWSSFPFMRDNAERIRFKQTVEDKHVHIIYLGDLDPSGLKMSSVIVERTFKEYGIEPDNENFFERLAVTPEQTTQFNLLRDADLETKKKLRRDPNRFEFMTRFGLKSEEDLFAIQLEAMQSPRVREYFRKLIQASVDKYFDPTLYKQVLSDRPSSEQIKKHVCKQLNNLLTKLY